MIWKFFMKQVFTDYFSVPENNKKYNFISFN